MTTEKKLSNFTQEDILKMSSFMHKQYIKLLRMGVIKNTVSTAMGSAFSEAMNDIYKAVFEYHQDGESVEQKRNLLENIRQITEKLKAAAVAAGYEDCDSNIEKQTKMVVERVINNCLQVNLQIRHADFEVATFEMVKKQLPEATEEEVLAESKEFLRLAYRVKDDEFGDVEKNLQKKANDIFGRNMDISDLVDALKNAQE